MAKRTVVTCDYCGGEFDAGRLGDLELRFSQGIRNLVIGTNQQHGETSEKWLARITHLSDACPACVQKAGAALGLQLECDGGRYYFSRKGSG